MRRFPAETVTLGHHDSLRAANRAALAAFLLFAAALPLAAQDRADDPKIAADQKLIATGKADSEIMANLTYLSDVIGPRLTGSANLKRANEWAAEKMRSYGLENVRLEPWELPIGWERGYVQARLIEPDNGRTITAASMGWTPGTKGKVTGDVVVVKANTPEELKAYAGKLKNAIVLRGEPARVAPITDLSNPFDRDRRAPGQEGTPPAGENRGAENRGAENRGANPPAGDQQPRRPQGFNTRGGFNPQFRREMAEFLRNEGVAVLLQDSAKPHGLLNMTGNWGGRDRASAPEPLPTLFVTHDHYAMLHRLATTEGVKPRMEIEVANNFIPGPIAVYNTVGEIRGSEKPDEFVVCGAHIDSWDLGQGTTDNGTGTCVVLETARIIMKSGVRPKRTIRFVLFSGEEQGLHGSRQYCQLHEDEMPKTSAAIVHDTGTGRVIGLALQGREVLKPLMEAEMVSLKELGVNDVSARSMSGSDHQSFEGKGVPGFMFRQDGAEYRLTHHSQSDTLDKARPADLVQSAQVMAIVATRIANLDSLLPRERRDPQRPTTPPAQEEKKDADKKDGEKKDGER